MEPFGAGRRLPGVHSPRPAAAPPPSHLGDSAQLLDSVRRARLGSTFAFEHLVRSTGPSLHRFLVARTLDERDARDALQETFLAAWQGLPALRQPERFWPWLVGIAAHKAADAGRRRRHAVRIPEELAAPEAGTLLELREVVGALPPRLRDVVLLRYLLRLSEEETAAALGIRVGTVKSRAARARSALLEALA